METDRLASPAHSPAGAAAAPWKLRVLVVEDELDTAETLAQLLRVFGFEARLETDGPAALQWARSNQPDVVLLDIGLPGGMDGHELARQLREQAAAKPPLLVAITGSAREEDRRRSEEAGIHLHLVKPVEPEQVHALLRRFERVIMPPA
jgi:CheY-like chemotaxis protein